MNESPAAARPHHLIRIDILCVVFVGGTFGTALRYALSTLPAFGLPGEPGAFHIGTFIANMLAACAYAGLTAYLSGARWLPAQRKEHVSRGLGMGLCGGLSTMSTLALEEFTSLRDGAVGGTLAYCLLTFACGLLLAWIGVIAGLRLVQWRGNHMEASTGDGNACDGAVTDIHDDSQTACGFNVSGIPSDKESAR